MRALCTLLFSTAAGVAVLARLRRFKPFCGRGLRYINKLRRKVFTTTAFVGVVGAVTSSDSCMMLEYWRRNPDRKNRAGLHYSRFWRCPDDANSEIQSLIGE